MTPIVKPAWLSKTLIVNGVVIAAGVLAAILDSAGVLHLGATTVVYLTIALAATAAIRLTGLACLGRPRTPRASAAEDPARATGVALMVLAGLSLLAGLFPSGVLALAAPALRGLAGTGMAPVPSSSRIL